MAPNLQKFCGRLVKQGLFQVKELESIYRNWRATAPNARDDLQSFVNFVSLRGNADIAKLQAICNGLESAPTPPPLDVPEFEVELVSEPDPKRLGGRDIIAFAIGAAVGGALVGAIALVIRFATNRGP